MRYRTRREEYTAPHTVGGVTEQITRTREVHEPIPPRDWDTIALRAVTGVIVALTLISVIWSTASIAHLLGAGAVGYLAALVFDAAWITTLGMAYLVRHRPDRRRTVDWLGWVLVAVTVTAIGVEGWQTGGLDTACAGAAVSLIAKGLWWALDRATRAELADLDRQWLAARLSQLAAQRATASMQRQVAREQERIGVLAQPAPRVDPDLDRPRGSTRPDPAVPAADPTPAIEAGPTRPDPTPTADPDPTPEQADPTPAPTPARKPTRTRRPGLHAVPTPAELQRSRAVLAEMKKAGVRLNRDEFKERMGVGTKKANQLWAQVDPKRQGKPRRSA